MLLLLLFIPPARAACVVSQTHAVDGIELDIAMDGSCPSISIIADRDATVRAWQEQDGFRRKLPKENVEAQPWGTPSFGFRVAAPLLRGEDHLLVRLTWSKPAEASPHVDVLLDGSAPKLARGGRCETEWMYVPGKHPEWGFTDPKHGRVERRSTWTFGEDGEAGWLDGFVAGAGGWWGGGPGTVQTASVQAPAAALGWAALPPGTWTLRVPGGQLVVAPGEPVPEVATVVAAAGGEVRWRVATISGIPVVPDEVSFVAGSDSRYRVASLPEPSVPMSLRGGRDKAAALAALWEAVREPPRGVLGDAGHPRHLNRAWRSGWLTDAERALVLLRFLGQERIPARWVLTGANPDSSTFVGFDHLLIAAQLPGTSEVIWLDPACRGCALGEIDPALSGQPAMGGAASAPVLDGTLTLTAALTAEGDVETVVSATGAGARWVEDRAGTDERALAELFGVVAASSVVVERGKGTVRVVFRSAGPPKPVGMPGFGGG